MLARIVMLSAEKIVEDWGKSAGVRCGSCSTIASPILLFYFLLLTQSVGLLYGNVE